MIRKENEETDVKMADGFGNSLMARSTDEELR